MTAHAAPPAARIAAFAMLAVVAARCVSASVEPGDGRTSVVVLEYGISESGARWELRHREVAGQDCLELSIDGAEPNMACGFDIPNTTEVGFGGGLKPGQGDFFLFGLTSSRVSSIVAESPVIQSEVKTKASQMVRDNPHFGSSFWCALRLTTSLLWWHSIRLGPWCSG